jgi:hypothetical protein
MKRLVKQNGAFFRTRLLCATGLAVAATMLGAAAFGVYPSRTASAQQQLDPVKTYENQDVVGMRSVAAYHHDESAPLRDLALLPLVPRENEKAKRGEGNGNPKIPHRHVDAPDPVVQGPLLATLAPSIPGPILNFDGIGFPGVSCNCAPPDTVGEIGATQFVQMVNKGYQVFNKATGASVLGPVDIQTIWAGFGGVCENSGDGDPVVMYDQLADRWVITQFASATSNITDECIAVSKTGDATGAYYRYGFHLGENFYDYPHFGVWPDGYYMAMNVFNASGTAYLGPQAFAFDRAAMLTGRPATFITPGITGGSTEETFLPADMDGHIPPPAGAPNIFVEWPSGSPLVHKVFKFTANFATPANSSFVLAANVPAAPFTEMCPTTRACVPQLGSTANLDAIGDRLMYRVAYRRFANGQESLIGNYTVNSSGVAAPRWFEMRNITSGTMTMFQQSTYQPDNTHRWMGSVAMDNQGNFAIGYSASSSQINPQIRWAGRLVTDPLNTLAQGEATMFAGTGSQTGTGNRWGDYSDMTVDPIDDCTFWHTNEYYATTAQFAWRTRIGNFKFSQCTPPPRGTARFTVTTCDGNAAVADALIRVDGMLYGASSATGVYDAPLSPGTHTYSISKPPIFGQPVTGTFTVVDGQTTPVNVCLVGSPLLSTGASSLQGESCAPANGAIDPGESVAVSLCVVNTGGAATNNLVGTLQTTGGVTNVSGPESYGAVSPNGSPVCRTFTFTASGQCGGSITATLQLQDGANNLGTVAYNFSLGAQNVTLSQNFDAVTAPALPSGWIATQGTNAGGFPLWVTSSSGSPTPVADTAPNSAFTPDPSNVLDNRLATPSFTYGAGARLSFRHNYNLEQQSPTVAYDCGVLEISVNGGAFTDIVAAGGTFASGGYSHTSINTGFSNPLLPSRPNWSGNSGGFITTVVNLPSSAAGQPVVVRWRLGTDSTVSAQGWRVDTVRVSELTCATNCSAPTAVAAVSRKTHGNGATFDINMPLTGSVASESRRGTGTNSNDHTLVVSFATPVTVTGTPQAQVTSGIGTVGSNGVSNGGAVTISGSDVIVPLTNVANAQALTVTLNGVNNGSGTANVVIPMGFLLGDSNGDRTVNSGDALQTRSRAGQGADSTNFRSDVNTDGAVSAGDTIIVRGQAGNFIP